MGRKNKRHIDEAAFKALDRRFRENADGDLLVRAFNTLPADDRALMLAYITVGNNTSELARMAGVSRGVIESRLWRIQVVVKERYEKLVKQQEDEDIF